MIDKQALRQHIRTQKRALSPAQIEAASAVLAQQLFGHPLYRKADSVYGYLSYNQEVRTLPILRRALADGKRVAAPRICGSEIRFLWLQDLSGIETGERGIPAPPADAPEADDPAALVLLPGLAFDLRGHRVGYGGGFYDRFLASHPHPTIALCYDFQLFRQIPTQPHDIPADVVLSTPIQE